MKSIILFILISLSVTISKSQNVDKYMSHHSKARNLILEGEYNKAILELDAAIDIMPYYTAMYRDRAYAYMQLKEYYNALSDLNIVLNKKPYLTQVKLQKAIALYNLDILLEAREIFWSISQLKSTKYIEANNYLEIINKELTINNNTQDIFIMRRNIESDRIKRSRHRESFILNTIIPLALWSTIFISQ